MGNRRSNAVRHNPNAIPKHRGVEIVHIVTHVISRSAVKEMTWRASSDMVKGVVDVKRGIVAIEAAFHFDLEVLLLNQGSEQQDLWAINLYPDAGEGFLEVDPIINIRPDPNNRSRGVSDPATQEKKREIVGRWFA